MKINMIISALSALSFMTACGYGSGALSDEALLDSVERRTFDYFWDGAEPNSGLARERIHTDGNNPQEDDMIVTTGGSGFGIMALIAGIDRNYISREDGVERFERIVSFWRRQTVSTERGRIDQRRNRACEAVRTEG